MEEDFGFTAMTVEDVKQAFVVPDQEKAKKIYDMILPFLLNLKKDSDTTPILNWPNRGKQIDSFIKKLDAIIKD